MILNILFIAATLLIIYLMFQKNEKVEYKGKHTRNWYKKENDCFISINLLRHQLNLMPLHKDDLLNKLARERANEMLAENKLSHNGFSKVAHHMADLNVILIGENIGYNTPSLTGTDMTNMWYNSKIHKELMLNPKYKYCGIGIAIKDNKMYYCGIFAK